MIRQAFVAERHIRISFRAGFGAFSNPLKSASGVPPGYSIQNRASDIWYSCGYSTLNYRVRPADRVLDRVGLMPPKGRPSRGHPDPARPCPAVPITTANALRHPSENLGVVHPDPGGLGAPGVAVSPSPRRRRCREDTCGNHRQAVASSSRHRTPCLRPFAGIISISGIEFVIPESVHLGNIG
jgi:hypothetical protein